MKYTPGFIFLLALSFSLHGQDNPFYVQQDIPNRDSLQSIIKNTKDDLTLMKAYRELGYSYSENKRDSAILCYEKIILLSKKADRKLWEADASIGIAFISYVQGNYPRSLQFLLRSKNISEDPDSEKNTGTPTEKSNESLRIARLSLLSRVHNHLASLYGFTGNFKDNAALELFHFKESLRLAELIQDKRLQSIVLMNIARHYSYTDRLDSVLYFGNKSKVLMQESGYYRYLGAIHSYIGNAYTRHKQYDRARETYWKAVKESKEVVNLRSLGDSYLALSNLYRTSGDLDSAIYYGEKAAMNFQVQGTSILSGMADSYTSLTATYQMKNNIDSAFKYQSLSIQAREDLSSEAKLKQFQNMNFDEQLRIQQILKDKNELRNKIMVYSLLSGIVVFMIIAFLLLKNNRMRKKANTLLKNEKEKVEVALIELRNTQSQLIQSEKMASLGELTAGIAHEIQNPLNFVNNFSEVNTELIKEIQDERRKTQDNRDESLENDLLKDISLNQEKINHHGKRAADIVKGMLQHSRSSSGVKEPTDINALADEYLRLAYHGLRAKDKSFNATMNTDFDETLGNINVVPQDIGRVILNLITNAFYAVNERYKAESGKPKAEGASYEPTVSVSTKKVGGKVLVSVKDNGNGIPDKIKEKIFQPFFTTKPTGQGTGLGLSLSYDIVKAHGGELRVETNVEGTEFSVQLPHFNT